MVRLVYVKLFRRGFVVSQSSLGDKNLPFLWVAGPFCSNELCSFITTFERSIYYQRIMKDETLVVL